jgi:hypothetical protein
MTWRGGSTSPESILHGVGPAEGGISEFPFLHVQKPTCLPRHQTLDLNLEKQCFAV